MHELRGKGDVNYRCGQAPRIKLAPLRRIALSNDNVCFLPRLGAATWRHQRVQSRFASASRTFCQHGTVYCAVLRPTQRIEKPPAMRSHLINVDRDPRATLRSGVGPRIRDKLRQSTAIHSSIGGSVTISFRQVRCAAATLPTRWRRRHQAYEPLRFQKRQYGSGHGDHTAKRANRAVNQRTGTSVWAHYSRQRADHLTRIVP